MNQTSATGPSGQPAYDELPYDPPSHEVCACHLEFGHRTLHLDKDHFGVCEKCKIWWEVQSNWFGPCHMEQPESHEELTLRIMQEYEQRPEDYSPPRCCDSILTTRFCPHCGTSRSKVVTRKAELLKHYAQRDPHPFYQFDVFVHVKPCDAGASPDTDGDRLFSSQTYELMSGRPAVRVLVRPDIESEDAARALKKVAGVIELTGVRGPETDDAPF